MIDVERLHAGAAPLLIAEIGVNHLGSATVAIELARLAKAAGFDLVKLQFRTPELNVTPTQRERIRDTPWGRIAELDYRRRIELTDDAVELFAAACGRMHLPWTASCWDVPALQRLLRWAPPFVKIPSPRLRHRELLTAAAETNLPVIISTGMSTLPVIRAAVDQLAPRDALLAHTVSAYPCPVVELNLNAIGTLKHAFPRSVVGYSGHEQELWPSYVAAALGAQFIERHVTLSRSVFGTDQVASIEPAHLREFCATLKSMPRILGSGRKRMRKVERATWARLDLDA